MYADVQSRTDDFTRYQAAPLVAAAKSMVKVAAIPYGGCNGCQWPACTEQLGLIHAAGSLGDVDVVVLPEEFLWNAKHGDIPPAGCDLTDPSMQGCPMVVALGAIAKNYSMHIVFGMRAPSPSDDVYPADPSRGGVKLGYNTVIILNREGAVAGFYRKSWRVNMYTGPTI